MATDTASATCEWIKDGWHDAWDTLCGNKHQFIVGGPDDNGYEYCPYCGGKLLASYEDAEDE